MFVCFYNVLNLRQYIKVLKQNKKWLQNHFDKIKYSLTINVILSSSIIINSQKKKVTKVRTLEIGIDIIKQTFKILPS